jgi:putative membrane protein
MAVDLVRDVFPWIQVVLMVQAILFHLYAFYMESVSWMTPKTRKTFRRTFEAAQGSVGLAANQGAYNLQIAFGLIFCLIFYSNITVFLLFSFISSFGLYGYFSLGNKIILIGQGCVGLLGVAVSTDYENLWLILFAVVNALISCAAGHHAKLKIRAANVMVNDDEQSYDSMH